MGKRNNRIDTGDGKADYPYRKSAEASMGRRLGSKEHVHHMDGDPSNDDFLNTLVTNDRTHRAIHDLKKAVKDGQITLFDHKGRPYKPKGMKWATE